MYHEGLSKECTKLSVSWDVPATNIAVETLDQPRSSTPQQVSEDIGGEERNLCEFGDDLSRQPDQVLA
jgi:hypothetical protein